MDSRRHWYLTKLDGRLCRQTGVFWKRATTGWKLHGYLRANKTRGQRSTYPIRTAEVYSVYSSSRECLIGNRKKSDSTGKHRTGKHEGQRAYKSFLYGSDPTLSTSHKIFNTGCRDAQRQRFDHFGEDSGKMDCLTKHPVQAVAHVRRTFSSRP